MHGKYRCGALAGHATAPRSGVQRIYAGTASCAVQGEILMPDDASASQELAALTERIRFALESGDLDAIRDLLDPGARWGAPEGPNDADCRNRDQVIAWWASARAAGARAVVTEVTAGAGTLLVGLDVTGTPAAREMGGAAERWQVLTVRGDRIADIRGFDDRKAAAARAGVPA
jgi:SnoaL-like domain